MEAIRAHSKAKKVYYRMTERDREKGLSKKKRREEKKAITWYDRSTLFTCKREQLCTFLRG